MANPILVNVGTYNGGAGAAQSGFVTFSFDNTSGFEALIPIQITCPGTTSITAGAEATVFRSADNGTTWETQGTIAMAFFKPTTASQVQRRGVVVKTGRFLISVMVGGGSASTWTAQLLTAEVLTAYA